MPNIYAKIPSEDFMRSDFMIERFQVPRASLSRLLKVFSMNISKGAKYVRSNGFLSQYAGYRGYNRSLRL